LGLKLSAWMCILLLLFGLTACQAGSKGIKSLELYKYPAVLIPAPTKAILTRNNSKSGAAEEIALTKADLSPLMRVVRSAVDTSLRQDKPKSDAWNENKKFSLLFEYETEVELELVVADKPINLTTKKVLISLEHNLILVEAKTEVREYSGLQFSDAFRTFLQAYNQDSGFPLPPAKKDGMDVEKIPLAKPGRSGVEFLPPAEPKAERSAPH